MKNIVIMRGIPGSGKSTWIKKHLQDSYVRCSADDYFYDNGQYKFDPSKLPIAHDACYAKAFSAMRNGYDVVIDNTNIQFAHYARYIELANRFEYAVQIVTLLVPPEVGFLRNTHGVPKHTIERLARSLFESIQEKDHDS